jgi:hypothetical protein
MQLTRAKTITTATAKLRRWLTADGALSLTESHSLYGLGTRYYVARRLANGNELPISRHRRKAAALRRVEAEAKPTTRRRKR